MLLLLLLILMESKCESTNHKKKRKERSESLYEKGWYEKPNWTYKLKFEIP